MKEDIYDFNYSSESLELTRYNAKLAECFKKIYLLYCQYGRQIGEEFNIHFMNCFTNPYLRKNIMTEGVTELRNAGYDIDDLYGEYVELDKAIAVIQDKINRKLSEYEDCCTLITTAIIGSSKDISPAIDSYFGCVLESYNNYINHGFEDEFTFKSTEMRESSFHSIVENGERRELNTTLSIPHNKVLHLMELPNPQSKRSFFAYLYRCFGEVYPEKIKEIKTNVAKNYDNDEIETRAFIIFINNYAKEYVKAILLNESINDDKRKIIINKCLERYKRENILLEMKKSFEKCINFRKMYEYKLIPEIVLDYRTDDVSMYASDEADSYRYRTISSAFTQLGNSDSKALREILTLNDDNTDFVLNLNIKMIDEDRDIIRQILRKFNNDLDIRIKWSSGHIKKDSDYVLLIAGDGQYKYYMKNQQFLSDDPVNTFLLSYDEDKMQINEIIDSYCMRQIMIILGYHLAKYLHDSGITYREDIESKSDIVSIFKKCEKNIKDIMEKNYEKGYSSSSVVSVYEDMKNISFNDGKLLNMDLLVNCVNYFLKYGAFESFKADIDDAYDDYSDFIKEFMPQYDEYKEKDEKLLRIEKKVIEFGKELKSKLISDDELDGLKRVVKSYFDPNINVRTFRKIFGIVEYDNEGYKPKTYSVPKPKLPREEATAEVEYESRIMDDVIPYSIIMRLAEGLKVIYESEFGLKSLRYDTIGSLAGFYVERSNDGSATISDYYVKTFMGKTSLQIISDLRINGFPYKLDGVYGEKNGKVNFYSIVPLSKYDSDYTLFYGKDKGYTR